MNWHELPEHLNSASGRFLGRIRNLDTSQWDTWRRRWFERKAWIFTGIHNHQFSIGFAIVDAGLLSVAFVYLFDKKTKKLFEKKINKFIGFPRQFSPSPDIPWHLENKHTSFQWNPLNYPFYEAICSDKQDNFQLCIKLQNNQHAVSTINQLIDRPFQYTEKNIGLHAEVQFSLRGEQHYFSTNNAIFDFSLGYPPRQSHWQWACLSGSTEQGHSIGINLVAQFFNGLENTIWINNNGTINKIALPQAIFYYHQDNILAPWHICTTDSCLNITFTPQGLRSENLNLGCFSSYFSQPFGSFEGTYLLNNQLIPISGHGVTEEHRAKW